VKYFYKAGDAAAIKGLAFHGLRHTYASILLARGVPIKKVSENLGHADVAFTLRIYAHCMPGFRDEAATEMQAAFAGADKGQREKRGAGEEEGRRKFGQPKRCCHWCCHRQKWRDRDRGELNVSMLESNRYLARPEGLEPPAYWFEAIDLPEIIRSQPYSLLPRTAHFQRLTQSAE